MSRAPKTNFIYLWRDQDTSKNIRKYMGTSWKNMIYGNMRPKKIEKCRNLNPHFFEFSFCIYFLDLFFGYIFWIYILKIILRRWGIENYTFSIIKQHPNLNMNFISIKKHEMEITLNFLILKDGTLNFFILKKGNHKT